MRTLKEELQEKSVWYSGQMISVENALTVVRGWLADNHATLNENGQKTVAHLITSLE